eukprot:404112_1
MAFIIILVQLIIILHSGYSQSVTCKGSNCICPSSSSGIPCILNCIGKDQCKDSTLKCRPNDACIINCYGENSCEGNSFIYGFNSKDVTINCVGDDACKQATIINCGTSFCTILCHGSSSCEGTIINNLQATNFQCTGSCNNIPAPYVIPTNTPTLNTNIPTNNPTINPTFHPTVNPTDNPTFLPTISATESQSNMNNIDVFMIIILIFSV